MTKPNEERSPLEVAAGAADRELIEAFKLVGNETRLAILLTLWEASDRPGRGDDDLSFTTLYDRVGYDTRGNFRYHLEQLEGQYVSRTAGGGYQLRYTGIKLVQTIIGGAGVANTEREPAEIDRSCELCGAPTAVSYEDGQIFHFCTYCEGRTTVLDDNGGYLNAVPFPPAGVTDRTPGELISAAEVAAYQRMRTMFQGLCNTCSGPVDAQLEVCPEHDATGICERCGWKEPTVATFQCTVCKSTHSVQPSVLCVFHPATIAFYYNHGVTARWHAEELDGLAYLGEHEPTYDEEVVSQDPPRVVVTINLDGDEFHLTFDESVTVVETSR